MTTTLTPPVAPAPPAGPGLLPRIGATVVRWFAALLGALVVFGAILLSRDVDPVTVLTDAWTSTMLDDFSLQQIVVKMAPFVLAALAVVVPARAGLANVGGEGQVVIGAVAAAGTALALDRTLAGPVVIVLMIVAAALAGAAWAGIAGVLRLTVRVNEAVTTLLLNYVAFDVLLFLIYQPWRDNPAGQPSSRELATAAKLPLLGGGRINVGIIIALVAVLAVWLLLRSTTWGFKLSVVGGNAEAARRAGLPVTTLLLSALLLGGALAGIGGMVHFAGVEYKLRPDFGVNIGYIGFLASWLARHRPLPVLLAAFTFAAFTVAGDSLQLDAGLPAATSNILTGLVLVAVLGWTAGAPKGAQS